MKINIYPCGYFEGVYCPYARRDKEEFTCTQEVTDCVEYREKTFKKIKKRIDREIALSKHKLKKLEKTTLEVRLIK